MAALALPPAAGATASTASALVLMVWWRLNDRGQQLERGAIKSASQSVSHSVSQREEELTSRNAVNGLPGTAEKNCEIFVVVVNISVCPPVSLNV